MSFKSAEKVFDRLWTLRISNRIPSIVATGFVLGRRTNQGISEPKEFHMQNNQTWISTVIAWVLQCKLYVLDSTEMEHEFLLCRPCLIIIILKQDEKSCCFSCSAVRLEESKTDNYDLTNERNLEVELSLRTLCSYDQTVIPLHFQRISCSS